MKKSSKNSLTVSIVNFNSGDFLIRCLDSLEKVKDEANLDIWVVDNASSDDSLQRAKAKFPKVQFIENSQNLGFGRAHNEVLENLKTEYVLIFNPDTKINAGVLSYMTRYMERNPDVGASSCKLVLDNGRMDWASHRGFPTPYASFRYYFLGNDSLYHLTEKPMDKPHEVDAISGSFFLTRKSVLDKVGFFDEDYFMYGEDIDLCFRIKKAGFKVMYIPEVFITHYKGVSSGLKSHSQGITTADINTKQRSLDAFYSAMKIFYKKNLRKNYPLLTNWLVNLGINIKWWMAKRKLTV